MANRRAAQASTTGRARRAFLAISASLSLVLSLGSAGGYGFYLWLQRALSTTDVDVGSVTNPDTGEQAIGGRGPCERNGCDYLLLGSDSRIGLDPDELERYGTNAAIGGEQRSDTIVLVHVPPGGGRAVLLSFPRDLWVRIPGKGEWKINSAFEGGVRGGGPERVAATVEGLTGIHVDHFLYVNLAGFEGVVDALGGVPMCVDRPMYDVYAGLNIPAAGCYRFDGSTALAYVRARKCVDTTGDFGRISRQQQFLRAVLADLLSPGRIADLPDLVGPVRENLVKDSELSLGELLDLAAELQRVSAGDADFRSVPGESTTIYPGGIEADIVQMDPSAEELFRRLRLNRPLGQLGREPTPANVRVGVFDRRSGELADGVLSLVQRSGFDALPEPRGASTLAGAPRGSALVYAPGARSLAELVAGYVPGLELLEADGELPNGLDVAVVIGPGYRPPEPGQGPALEVPPGCAVPVEGSTIPTPAPLDAG